MLLAAQAFGQGQPPKKDLTNLGMEDLMKIEVTTASKSSEAVSRVPSAIFVITQEMIRRAGANTIPDALRLAPGVDVARINSNQWAVSIRGFNSRFSDKLLVLLDGRSLYTPDFAGVLWDSLDLPMEDIERIEVIRGPGGSLWGANAVNGVVNIITKSAAETLGHRVSTEIGSFDRVIGAYEQGERLGGDRFLRVFARSRDTSAMDLIPGIPGPDEWKTASFGFRFDGGPQNNHWLLEGNAQSTHDGELTVVPSLAPPFATLVNNRFPSGDWSLLAHWERSGANGWSQTVQGSIAEDKHLYPEASVERTTLDFDYQAKLSPTGNHVFTLGAGYRNSPDHTSPGELVTFVPSERTQEIWSAFFHDDWSLGHHLDLLAGSKIEHDSFTGWEVEPNLQLLYTPDSRRTWWASVSRAVRTPARADEDANIDYAATNGPGNVPVLVVINGNPSFKSENVIASELGYRFEPDPKLFIDIAAFDNQYQNLRSIEPIGQTVVTIPVPHIVATYTFENMLHGQTDGLELVGRWGPCPGWKLTGVYSYFTERLRLASGSMDSLGLYATDGRGGSPRHMLQLRSDWDVTRGFEFDNDLYYTDATLDRMAPAFWRLDSRIGWNPSKSLKVSLGVRNAFLPHHQEADGAIFTTSEQLPRSAYLDVTWKF